VNDALTVLLDDLSHDLGKYLVLNLRFLPADGSDQRSELLDAVTQGLLRTHHKDGQDIPAHEVWARWLVALDDADPQRTIRSLPAFEKLVSVVETALAWAEPHLDEDRILANAAQARADLMAVPEAIRDLIKQARKTL